MPSSQKLIGTYISRNELTGDPGTITELTEKLSTLAFEDVIGWITTIATRFDYGNTHSRSDQMAIAKSLLSAPLLDALRARWSNREKSHEVIFHRQQLWVTLQLALLCCNRKSPGNSNAENVRIFGDCLLIANHIIGDQLTRKNKESHNPESAEWFIANFLSMLETNWHANGPLPPTRAYSMWVEMPRLPSTQADISRILPGKSPNDAFLQTYGVKLDDYLDFAVTIHFFFQDQNSKRQPLRIHRDVLSLLGDVDRVDRCLDLIARTPEQLSNDIIFGPRQSWALDFSPLRAHPIIKMPDKHFVCPDLQLLEYYFDDALLHLITNAYCSDNDIKQLYGTLFETHVTNVIGDFADHGTVLAKQFIRNPQFESNGGQVADCALDWPDTLALVESKATRLTRRQKYSGDSADLLKGIDDAYARKKDKSCGRKGVTQIAYGVNKILDGAVVVGMSPLNSRLLLPILVIGEPGITSEFVRRRLDAKLQSHIHDDHKSRVMPLVILSLFDIEALATYLVSDSAEKILRSYVQHLQMNDNLLDSFASYVHRKYGSGVASEPIYMQKLRHSQLHDIAERFGISEIDNGTTEPSE